MAPVIYWFRNDLRLTDAPALAHATQLAQRTGQTLLPVFCHAPPEVTRWGFARVGLHRQRTLRTALDDLAARLQVHGSRLVELVGAPATTLPALCHALGATHIVSEDIAAPEEQASIAALRATGLTVETVWQSSLLDPAQLPFATSDLPDAFSTFRQRVEKAGLTAPAPLPEPTALPTLPELDSPAITQFIEKNQAQTPPRQQALAALTLGEPEVHSSFPYHRPEWAGGETAALAHLRRYLAAKLPHSYKATRNQLSGTGFSSKFSPWLASGALSARTIYAQLKTFEAEWGANDGTYWLWFELLWRDYFRFLHLKYGARLYHAQGLRQLEGAQATAADNAGVRRSPAAQTEALQRWCQGRTGEALVDAAMRELCGTGYLSNRMRQVVASYLIYDLGGDWRAGAAWFESQLVDFDIYSNQGNWLYIAGLGTDPRGGRRFNPAKQTQDHDPDGRYRRLWQNV
ncbi:DASH family cryptochrome [Rhodoferax sp. U2-2l]|uniref:DASH family cryptochrome n=1 Tax=Rhodoferax sp. U2-2l TaxID=2884000 RepID=UPI001D0A2856|nr:DASH family cryptochrome [Rhodoferax sp. U2-2l]MCB8746836.1 DASH family cryptochrome [Rhodoferax sp. U2-2l]